MRRLLILLLLALLFTTSAFAQFDMQQMAVIQGARDTLGLGAYLAGIGDVNGDGIEDLAVAQNAWTSNNKKTFIYFGSKNFDTIPDVIFPFSSGYISHGDVNGDGIQDLLLTRFSLLSVLIYYGGSPFDTIPDKVLVAPDTLPAPVGYFPGIIAAGDINKDGYTDLAIQGNSYKVYVYWGGANMSTSPAYVLRGSPLYFGLDGLAIGDINGDGYADLAVSTSDRYPVDTTYIYFGGVELDTVPRLKLIGGGVVLGDMNGDGFSDIITTNGTYYGGAVIDSMVDSGVRSLGCSPAYNWTAVGKFNKDSYEDLLIGSGSIVGGDASIYLGSNPLDTIVDWHYRDYEVGCYGSRVGVADINGDGVDEVIVGDPCWWYNNPAYPPGRVYIYKNPYTAVEEEKNQLPNNFALGQNYPNPFNPSTTIPFSLKAQGSTLKSLIPTTITIYNLLGQKVRTLVDDERMPGSYQIVWDGKDNLGKKVTSGIYFYRIEAGDFVQSKKMVLIK